MVSSFTTNKSLEKPGNGDYVDTWNVPVNGDMDIIDQAFGGVTSFNATAGSATLTSTEYRSLFFSITGAIAAPVTYTLPSGVGGQWIVRNTTTDSSGGPHAVTFASAGGGTSVAIPRTGPVLVYSDGTNIRYSNVAVADSIASDAVTSAKIINGAVTTNKIADGALTADTTGRAKMADNFVNAAKIDAAAVTIAKINATGTPSGTTFLRGDGAWADPSGGTTANMVVFTASGSWTVPAGVTTAKVTVIGGGGGGGGNSTGGYNMGGGGGGGGGAIRLITGLTPGAAITVTVGAGGTVANNSAGGTGGTSSFGAFVSATGGSGGAANVVTGVNNVLVFSSASGTGSGGDINVPGGYANSVVTSTGTICGTPILNGSSVPGANSAFNYGIGGQLRGTTSQENGNPGTGYGGGGGGSSGTPGGGVARPGGAGAAGVVIVEW